MSSLLRPWPNPCICKSAKRPHALIQHPELPFPCAFPCTYPACSISALVLTSAVPFVLFPLCPLSLLPSSLGSCADPPALRGCCDNQVGTPRACHMLSASLPPSLETPPLRRCSKIPCVVGPPSCLGPPSSHLSALTPRFGSWQRPACLLPRVVQMHFNPHSNLRTTTRLTLCFSAVLLKWLTSLHHSSATGLSHATAPHIVAMTACPMVAFAFFVAPLSPPQALSGL